MPLDSNHLVPGTPTFFPALLAQVRDVAPPSLPLDPIVFQSILLCLIAGEKHLLLRAPEQDVRLVVKLAYLTLSSVFGLPTHKIKIRPHSTYPIHTYGAPFLRSLFVPWTTHNDAQDEAASVKQTGGSRNRTRNNATWARSSSKKPRRRSISNMSNSSEVAGGTVVSNPFGDSHEFLPSTTSSSTNPFSTAPRPPKTRTPLPHAFSDPTPLRPRSDRSVPLQPRALVLSGLENATMPSQRALARVLAEKRVVLEDEDADEGFDEVWNLPDGFLMVYVCPIDAHERPAIHKTLLDKFSMSATVSPHSSIRALLSAPSRSSASYRNSPAIHPTPLPPGQLTPTSSPPFLAQPIPLPHHSHSFPLSHQHHHVHHPLLQQPLVPPALLDDLRAAYHRTYLSPLLELYASDLFSAARHHPQLDAIYLTAKSMKDVMDLARAGRVVGGDLTGIELVRDDAAYAATQAGNGSGHAKTERDDDDDESLNLTPAPIQIGYGSGLAHRYQSIEVVVEELDGATTPPLGEVGAELSSAQKPGILEVSEADIARMAPRVMTHRLRVRDGPHDEALGSAMFPAVPTDQEDSNTLSEGIGRTTIKEILVRILAEV
ncbi:hypothetical protein B0H15DRAFT_862216 [Mycena belliarum]|uniref:Uncharacterized protein n=1 Tax=Mycena belliarum TaxID=1033014 RepID=A0AAD6XGI4_9AGAR|nr:hypothetical protein B0H15DRAFT_862216 [Mycena belliae]